MENATATTDATSAKRPQPATSTSMQLLVRTPDGEQLSLPTVMSSDNINDVRNLIALNPTVCFHTCYHLELQQGKSSIELNDYLQVQDYPGIQEGAELVMVLDKYDFKKARAHVQRLRDILASPPSPQERKPSKASETKSEPQAASKNSPGADGADEADSAETKDGASDGVDTKAEVAQIDGANDGGAAAAGSDDVKSEEEAAPAAPATAVAEKEEEEEEEEGGESKKTTLPPLPVRKIVVDKSLPKLPVFSVPVQASLPTLLLAAADATAGGSGSGGSGAPPAPPQPCLRGVCYSGWNPPPSGRRMQGDLLYLEVCANDGFTMHVTATASGFFVNATHKDRFNPAPAATPCHSHSLLRLLQRASPQFKKAYSHLLASAAASAAAASHALARRAAKLEAARAAKLASDKLKRGGSESGSDAAAAAAAAALPLPTEAEWMAGAGGASSPLSLSSSAAALSLSADGVVDASVDTAFAVSGGVDAQPWAAPLSGAAAAAAGSAAPAGAAAAAGPVAGGGSSSSKRRRRRQQQRQREASSSSVAAAAAAAHPFDLNRAERELEGRWGMDDRGQLRDWNEELATAREMGTANLEERVFRARALHRIRTEFLQAAKLGAVAILKGYVVSLNPMDPPASRVYSYNNIFFSIATDNRGYFAHVGGDRAARAVARLDLRSVAALGSMDIPGLHVLATVLVDYMGQRVVCQSIIPGILQGERASKMIYGSIDNGETVACEPQMHALMCKAAAALSLKPSAVKPLGKGNAPVSAEEAAAAAAVAAAAAAAAGAAGAEESVGSDASMCSEEVTVLAGPMNCKGILGSDGRRYILDLIRQTPLDYTFVRAKGAAKADAKADAAAADATTTTDADADAEASGEGKGTEAEAEAAAAAEGYEVDYSKVLRPELVRSYALWKQTQQRRANLSALRQAKQAEAEGSEETTAATADADAADAAAASEASAGAEETPKADAAADDEAAPAAAKAGTRMTQAEAEAAWAVPLPRLNVNAFTAFATSEAATATTGDADTDADADAESKGEDGAAAAAPQLTAEEDAVKEAALYLHNIVLPSAFKDLRTGALSPVEGRGLCAALHARGINLRYLGKLAQMVVLGETTAGVGMPPHALELLEGEMVARAAATMLGRLTAHADVAAAPAPAVATFLNLLLGKPAESDDAAAAAAAATAAAAAAAASPAVVQLSGRAAASALPSTHAEFWAAVAAEVDSKYSYRLQLWRNGGWFRRPSATAAAGNQAAAEAEAKNGGSGELLPSARALRLPLLRRLCQRAGLVVSGRDYALPPSASASGAPVFTSGDIVDLVPVVKHALPAVPLPEARQLLEAAQTQLGKGQTVAAYHLAREAAVLLQGVVAFAHAEVATACATMASTLAQCGDLAGAITQQQWALRLLEHLHGADSGETVNARASLALYLHACGSTEEAVPHLQRCLQLLAVMAGARHSEGASIYLNLGIMYQERGQVEASLAATNEALRRSGNNQALAASCSHVFALAFATGGDFRSAIKQERAALAVYTALLGAEDPRVADSSRWLASFTSQAVDASKEARRLQGERDREAAKAEAAALLRAAGGAAPGSRKNKKRRNKKR